MVRPTENAPGGKPRALSGRPDQDQREPASYVTQRKYDWSLLKYAEAVRTGQRLQLAAELRPRLLKSNPSSIAALDEVMPHKPPEIPKRSRERRRKDFKKRSTNRRQVTPRGDLAPSEAQVREIARLRERLGKEPYTPSNRKLAAIEIQRLQQVASVLGK